MRRVYFDGTVRSMGELWWACEQNHPRVWIECTAAELDRAIRLASELEDCGGNLYSRHRKGSRMSANVSICTRVPVRMQQKKAEEHFFERVTEMSEERQNETLGQFEIDDRLASMAETYGVYDASTMGLE